LIVYAPEELDELLDDDDEDEDGNDILPL